MAEKKLTIEQADPLLLYGFNDIHLRRVEAAFPNTKITARGNQIFLRGSDKELDHLERLLQELIVVLNRNDNLTENDVETAEVSVSGRIAFTPSVAGACTGHDPGSRVEASLGGCEHQKQ